MKLSLECVYETNKLTMHTTGVPTLKKQFKFIKFKNLQKLVFFYCFSFKLLEVPLRSKRQTLGFKWST